MTFTEFTKKVEDIFMANQAARSGGKNQLRYGQTIMNVLYDVWPEKFNEIRDSDINCFCSNRTVSIVLDKLEKEWHDDEI